MKKIILLVFCFLFLATGCGGHYLASHDTTNPNRSEYSGTAYGVLPPPGPKEMAQAELISAVAKNIRSKATNSAVSNTANDEFALNPQGSQEQTTNSTRYGVVVNNAKRPIWWQHPEQPLKFKIDPDSFLPLPLSRMPDSITVYQADGNYLIYNPTGKTKRFAELDTWFVYYIDQVN